MWRRRYPILAVLLVCNGLALGGISTSAEFIRDRMYQPLSSKDLSEVPVPVDPNLVKASGVVPSISQKMVAWADGRTGTVGIWGYDLEDLPRGEFIVSDTTAADNYQEGNPFVSGGATNGGGAPRPTAASTAVVVYDGAQINSGTEPGNCFFATDPGASPWSYNTATTASLTQRCPVLTGGLVAWVDDRNDAATPPMDRFPGNPNTDIYAQQVDPTTGALIGGEIVISASTAPQDYLAADNGVLVWQELRRSTAPFSGDSSWDVVGYDVATASHFDVIDDTTSGPAKNQIHPDISGNLVVWTQEEDPAGTGATNIYVASLLDPNAAPIPVTTTGTAARAAVSMGASGNFVVWQDYRRDTTKINYLGGNGELDYQWDIWCQEVAADGTLLGDAFMINGDPGRQTNPDICGLDVVWQTQGLVDGATGSEDIYVIGPIPEPSVAVLLLSGAALLVARRRRRAAP
jgi:hypothetical protein